MGGDFPLGSYRSEHAPKSPHTGPPRLDPTGEGIGHQLPMKPQDAVVSLRLMWEKLAEAIEEMPQETALQSMRVEACEALLSGILIQ